jgi:hypothetical protein
MDYSAYRLAGVQLIVVLLSAGLLQGWLGPVAVKGVLYGGLVAIANSLLLYWRMRSAIRKFELNAERILRSGFRSSLERFLLAGVLLWIGMGPMNIAPLPVIAGFIAGQLTYIIVSVVRGIK